MLKFDIPGFAELNLVHAVFDYNGTLSVAGKLIEGVYPLLHSLSAQLQLHVVTGDSFGTAKSELKGIDCKLTILPPENQGLAKRNYLQTLNPSHVVAIGNGRNDRYMLKDALLGIVTLGGDGTAVEALVAADVVVQNIFDAFGLLQQPERLRATLRA